MIKKKNVSFFSKLIVAVLLLIEMIPLYLVLVNLFKTSEAIQLHPFAFPTEFSMDSLRYVLTDPYKNIWVLYWNTIVLTVGGVILTLLVSSMAAYYIARCNNRFTNFLNSYLMTALSVPVMILFIPIAFLMRLLNLTGAGQPVIILLYTAFNISFATFVYTGFLKSLPRSLEDAARIDGAGSLAVFFKIILPLLKPATTTIAVFIGCAMWNDFLTPLLLGGGIETITTGIYSAIGNNTTDWARVFAYVFTSSLPTVLVFLAAQKNFIEGITAGAIKS